MSQRASGPSPPQIPHDRNALAERVRQEFGTYASKPLSQVSRAAGEQEFDERELLADDFKKPTVRIIVGIFLASLFASYAAAPTFDIADFDYGSFSQSSLLSSTSLQSFDHQSMSLMTDSTMVARWEGQSFDDTGSSFQQMSFSSEGLAPAIMDLPALSQLAQGYDMPVNMQAADSSTFAAADVVIPSLEALVASFAQNGGATQLSGVVADVLADALAGGGGGLNIDSLLNGLPGLGETGMAALASHGMTDVSAWDMGAFGGFTGIHQAFTMETLVLHQDTVMPQA